LAYLSFGGYELWRLRLFFYGGYGLALAAMALAVFWHYRMHPEFSIRLIIKLKNENLKSGCQRKKKYFKEKKGEREMRKFFAEATKLFQESV